MSVVLDLGDREPGDLHVAEQRTAIAPFGCTVGDAGEVVVAEDGDLEHVAGADLVVGRTHGRGDRAGLGAAGGCCRASANSRLAITAGSPWR